MSEVRFVVLVKPSARRTNGAVGRLVNQRGGRHIFSSRDDAELWARGLSSDGENRVWIRRADPRDRSDADAYLVGRRVGGVVLDGARRTRRQRLREGSKVERVELF